MNVGWQNGLLIVVPKIKSELKSTASYTWVFPVVLLMVLRTVWNFLIALFLLMRRLSAADSLRLKRCMYGLGWCMHRFPGLPLRVASVMQAY